MKHVAVKYHFVRDLISLAEVQVLKQRLIIQHTYSLRYYHCSSQKKLCECFGLLITEEKKKLRLAKGLGGVR